MRAHRKGTRGKSHPVDVHVGERLFQRRSLMGMSQEKLGKLVGLSFQQIQKYERAANRISASMLFHLARALEVPVGWFFEDMPDALKESCNVLYPGLDQKAEKPESDDSSCCVRPVLTGLMRLRSFGWVPAPA